MAVYPSEGLANLTSVPNALPSGLLPYSAVKSSCWPRSLPQVRRWPWDTAWLARHKAKKLTQKGQGNLVRPCGGHAAAAPAAPWPEATHPWTHTRGSYERQDDDAGGGVRADGGKKGSRGCEDHTGLRVLLLLLSQRNQAP